MKIFNISHLYYTKSLKQDGEGVFACSETLNREEKSEIEKTVIVGYEAPKNMPFAPTTEEDMVLFPKNYAYYKLKSCRKQALLLSTYTGRCNHTPNRFGNFLTHIILFEESISNTKLPTLLKTLPFRTHLTIEEEQNFEIDGSIFSIDINKLKNTILLQESISFLNADNNRKLVFKKITDLIVDGWLKAENHRIVIKASQNEVKDFIFSLYSILPSCLINQYSFGTYKSTLRDSPFQIVGILSDANIKLMDNDLLFDLSKNLNDYKSNNEFTELVYEIISNANLVNLEEYFSDYDLVGLPKNLLNYAVKTIRFKVNISNETLSALKEVLENQPNTQKEQELITFVIQHNSDLFLKYIFEIIKEKVRYKYSVEEKINLLFDYFKRYFSDNKELLPKFYEYIYIPLSQGEKGIGEMAYFLFMKFEIDKILNDFSKEDELRLIDSYLYNNQIFRIDMKLQPFLNKHIGIITEKVPFLYSKKVKEELLERIKNGVGNPEEITSKIQSLSSDDDRFFVIASYLYTFRAIGVFDLSFATYLSLVESCCGDKKYNFWEYFFSIKDYDFMENYHSLSFLKRQFVIFALEKEDYQKIISRLNFTNFEIDWLIDYFRERGESNKNYLFKNYK